MLDPRPINRRRLLQAGGGFGLAAAATTLLGARASAAPPTHHHEPGHPGSTPPTITDLGPGVVQFSLMSGLLVGDTVYIGSRNLAPARLIGFHVPTRTVVSSTDLGSGYSIQALAADATGRYLYAGVLRNAADSTPNLYRWDLTTPATPAVALGQTGERDVRALAVAPDGKVFAVGGNAQNAPALWEYDPATGAITSWGVPDPGATLAQAVAATDTAVFFGAGSVLAGGGSASNASLFAFDRTTRKPTSILPPAFATGVSVTSLSVLDDSLAVGVNGLGKSALIDLADYTSATVIPRTAVLFRQQGDQVYFVNDPYVWAYSTTSKSTTQVETADLGTLWGLDVTGDGKLEAVSADGFVAEIDPTAASVVRTDLVAAGAPAGAQLAMGVAAGGGYAYLGGTSTIARHELSTGAVVNLSFEGEAKDALVLNGVLYTGQYNNEGIWSYDPNSGVPHQVAALANGQNRPLNICWDAVNGLLLAGAQDDTAGGGSLAAYNPKTAGITSWVNPIDTSQTVRAVATADGIAYLGGDNIYPTGPRGTVVAWDPVAGRELWRLVPTMGAGIAALAVQGRYLFAMGRHAAGLTVIDRTTATAVQTVDMSSVCTDFGALVVNRGFVYGVSDSTVFRIDPETFAVTAVVPGINGAWYSGPHIGSDENGYLYTMRDRNLVRIDDQG
ncbi:hypothetical protein [Catenulispora pinisilvae]|uniref:hypothetical protein n=1 Tax=Catenulispora pinisilvae TaxID=2705253 RepID=UPI00189211E1|nr:hypothetical protein [Catenulispora pinisilvae]